MKKLFTLFVLLAMFMGAKAETIVDAYVDFSQYASIDDVPRFSWGGAQQAWDRLSIQDGCLHWHSTEVPLNDDGEPTSWLAQWFPIGGVNAEVGVVYTLHFKVKGDHAENISALGFGQTPYGQFPITTDWVEGTYDYECTDANGDILMQAGGYVGDFDIAYLKITHEGKVEKPATWKGLLTNGDAEKSWAELGLADVAFNDAENNTKVCFWSKEKGHNMNENNGWDPFPAEIVEVDGGHAFICRAQTADTEGDASAWDNQIWIQSPRAWKAGETFKLSFRYKASEPVKTNTQVHKQTPSDYLHWVGIGDIDFTTEWQTFEKEVTVSADQAGMYSIAFNLNPNVKTPVDFYMDDLYWGEMELEHGLYIAATNTETGLVDYDFDAAIEFVYDETAEAMSATVGTKGKEATWVNEVMISTVRGNDRQFKANTLKTKGAVVEGEDNWVDYEDGANYKIKLPAQGVWTVLVDTDAKVMAFVELEGDTPREPLDPEECVNESEITVNSVGRAMTQDEGKAAGYEEGSDELAACTGQPWDNQFFIIANRALAVGELVYIQFEYRADNAATVSTQNSQGAGGYLHWAGLGNIDFTSEWQTYKNESYAIPSETSGNQDSFTFNLSNAADANVFQFRNFTFMTADFTENLINKEGVDNFMWKEGANTAAFNTGINTVVNSKVANNAIYNIAGQRVSENYKGIVVKNGRKYLNK